MIYDQLCEESKNYVDRYIRTSTKTRDQALMEKIVQNVIDEYEHGNKNRLIFY